MTEPRVVRVVMVTLRGEYRDAPNRARLAEAARRVFPTIPGVVSIQAGVPAEEDAAATADLVLIVGFSALSDVAAYRVHPIHVGFVEEFLKPVMADLRALNVDVGTH